jgi:hypothetical protein
MYLGLLLKEVTLDLLVFLACTVSVSCGVVCQKLLTQNFMLLQHLLNLFV